MKVLVITKGTGRPDFTYSVIKKAISENRRQIATKVNLAAYGAIYSFAYKFPVEAPKGYLISSITVTRVRALIEGNYTTKLVVFKDYWGNKLVSVWFNQIYDLYTEDGIYQEKYDPPQKNVWFPLWVGIDNRLYAEGYQYYEIPSIHLDVHALVNYEEEESS